jgi:hypothetical protein
MPWPTFEQGYGGHDSITKLLSLPNPACANSIHVDNPQGLLVLISGSFDGWGFSARTPGRHLPGHGEEWQEEMGQVPPWL